jgi:Caspase domain
MLKRHLLSFLLPFVVAAMLALSGHANAQSRVALVVGNSAYAKVPSLPNPAHDAQDVSAALMRLGFTVKTVTDADFDGMRRALLEFGRTARNADMAVFYFAGHGVEINGSNWLLPTDVELKSDVDASTEAIGLQSAMQAVATARTLGLVILDACRNNPFQSTMRRSNAARSVQILGLAPVEPADNVLVAYAARDGTVAADGAGRNSPYTAALLKHIETPGLEVDFLFRNVRDDVMAATDNGQQPFLYGSLSSDEIYFKPPPAGVAAADPTPQPDAAEIAWSFLKATDDLSSLSRFVERFPESSHVSDVRVRIASLTAAPPSTAVTDAPSPPVTHVTFLDTEFAQAEKAVARRFVRDTAVVEAAWDVIKESKDHTVIRHFVDQFPSKKRRVVADTRLVALGQKPITVHAAPAPLLNVDEAVLAQAAADPDVMQCFLGNDQTAPACQRAFERFPDIGHFAEDIRFTLAFCQAMGNPSGCVPTVKTTWNFPNSNPDGGRTGTGGGTLGGVEATSNGGGGVKTEMRLDSKHVDSKHFHLGGNKGLHTEGLKSSSHGNGVGKHHAFANGALKLQQSGSSAGGAKTTSLKTTGIKVTNATGIKTPTNTTPSVKTPNVKVDVKPNSRLPNISVPHMH